MTWYTKEEREYLMRIHKRLDATITGKTKLSTPYEYDATHVEKQNVRRTDRKYEGLESDFKIMCGVWDVPKYVADDLMFVLKDITNKKNDYLIYGVLVFVFQFHDLCMQVPVEFMKEFHPNSRVWEDDPDKQRKVAVIVWELKKRYENTQYFNKYTSGKGYENPILEDFEHIKDQVTFEGLMGDTQLLNHDRFTKKEYTRYD